jgi:hypothetical protein
MAAALTTGGVKLALDGKPATLKARPRVVKFLVSRPICFSALTRRVCCRRQVLSLSQVGENKRYRCAAPPRAGRLAQRRLTRAKRLPGFLYC